VKILKKIEEVAFALEPANRTDCHFFHVAAIFKRNKILSIGQNSFKTHPIAQKYGHRNNSLHAEISSAIRYGNDDFSGLSMAVLRISRQHKLALSKPCEHCQKFLLDTNLKNIFYTDEQGNWRKLKL
jgi:deoxycytidylate deaminase